jgi:imipenem/basic amino acid-specific outer membrane pore
MKLGKLSLVAVMALGTSAFAIDNVKVSGDVKVIYQTSDVDLTAGEKTAGAQTGLFEQGTGAVVVVSPYNAASAGGITGRIGVTADLLKSVSAGAEVQVYSTLGLDNNVFGDNMINAPYGQTGFTNGDETGRGLSTNGSTFADRTKDASNISQLWLATTMGKTTVKAGRMELDTPLIFTEKWNLAYNTFESIVAVNTDLPDTSIVGAWIGKHNGHGAVDNRPNTMGVTPGDVRVEGGIRLAGSPGRTVNMNEFRTFGFGQEANGAYAIGAVNKSIANTTLQAWYYNVVSVADAVWLQADTKVAGMVSLGAQYATMNPSGNMTNLPVAASAPGGAGELSGNDSKIWAVKAAVDVSGINLYVAYSEADKDGYLGFSNMSTADKTNIYTGLGSIYFDGVVTAPGVKTHKIGVKGSVAGVNLEAAYVDASSANWSSNFILQSSNGGINGYDFSASTNIGKLGLTAMYTIVNNEATDGQFPPNGNPYYFGRDIDTLRLIAQLKF